jgi:TrkA domain protein
VSGVEETPLPGVGVRYDFVTAEGDRLGVLVHRTGRRDLLFYDKRDPDTCRFTTELSNEEARTLSELLGASHVTQQIASMQQLEGLAIDWLPIEEGSPWVNRAISDAAVRTRTGVSIVAIVRADSTVPAPTPDFVFAAGDTLVVVGTAQGINALSGMLHSGL